MNIKEILLAGGNVSFSYKEKPKEWVSTARIVGFSGGFGMKPKIIVEVPCKEIKCRQEFQWDDADNAVNLFKELVFRPKNLCFKMDESMVELYKNGETKLDLDIPEDLKKVRKLQRKKQKELQQNGLA